MIRAAYDPTRRWAAPAGLAALAVLIFTAGCAPARGMLAHATPTRGTPTVPPPLPETAPPPAAAPGTLLLRNSTGIEICYVNVAPSEADSWGPNQLSEGETIPDGGARAFTRVPRGDYDLLVRDCDRKVIAQANRVPLGDAAFTWLLGEMVAPTFVNRGAEALCELYLSPSFAGSWGPNLLSEGEPIGPGQPFNLRTVPAGMYDVRTVTCAGTEAEARQVEVTADLTYTFGE